MPCCMRSWEQHSGTTCELPASRPAQARNLWLLEYLALIWLWILLCQGEGEVTVVLDAGLGMSSLCWHWIGKPIIRQRKHAPCNSSAASFADAFQGAACAD